MFKSGESPIPGYSLLKMLGRGEYGEVWEVEGPGGTHLAIKFIPLHDKKGLVELRSVQAVKLIRHANLVPIHAIWLLDNDGKVMESDSLGKAIAAATQSRADKTMVAGAPQFDESIAFLVICMSLADGNLQDTLDNALQEGQAGIPVKALLEYTRQAALGLDFLNSPVHLVDGNKVGIQHRDVKPANLLVMGDTVVVGDFGVATTLKEFDATGTSALGSMAFMAPESFSRKPSQSSDQYALAITYYKLRSNHLPYDPQVSISELISIHTNGKLDFSKVPVAEQQVLMKAAAPDPKTRFASCKEFCDALIDCHRQLVPAKRSKAPAVATSISVLAIGLVTVMIMDPFGWFTKPDPLVVAPEPVAKNYALTITPGDVTGKLTIIREGSSEPASPIEIRGTKNIDLFGDEQISVQASSPNPFLGSVDQTFSVEELVKQNWTVSLPEVSKSDWLAKIDQHLESGELDEAGRLYTSGAKFDATLKDLPVPVTYELEGSINDFMFALEKHRFAVSSQNKTTGAVLPLWFSIENAQLVKHPMPTLGSRSSYVQSLLFSDQDKQLIVIREESIERWDLESNSLTALTTSSDDSSTGQRWMGGVVSDDGKWLAVYDFDDIVHVFDLTGEVNGRPFASCERLNQPINKLFSNGNSRELTIVCESLPLFLATIPQLTGSPLQVRPLAAEMPTGEKIVVDAARFGKDSTLVATKQAIFLVKGSDSVPGRQFDKWNELERPSISRLRAAMSGDWFLTGMERDPKVVLWNIRDKKPALELGTQDIPAISDAVFSSDGSWGAITSTKGAFKLVDLRGSVPKQMKFLQIDNAIVQNAGFTADMQYLVAVINYPVDGRVELCVWDFRRCWLALDARTATSE